MKHAKLRAEKGVLEVDLELENNCIKALTITGDFFIYPEETIEDLEAVLIGSPIREEDIRARLSELYQQKGISTPGIKIDDWIKVLTLAANQ